MNMEPLRLEKYNVSFLQVSGRNMFISRLKYNLVLFVFLSKDPLLDIYCGFIHIELLTNGHYNSCLNKAHLTHETSP